ncbi:unnamed protein product [Rotaria sp. Silwood1]|nr:unnamed protein product [Rotaria sp. Silwood1]
MKSAFNDVNRIGCSTHYINKTMEKTFTDTNNDDLKEFQDLFVQVKQIVEHVRRCHKQTQLSKKLQMYSKTKFNGAFHMFNVFNELFDEIPRALDTKFLLTYSIINRQSLQQVCDFISIFDEVIEKLSDDARPTLHRVIPFRQHVIDHCSTRDNDDDNLIHMKKIYRYLSTSTA